MKDVTVKLPPGLEIPVICEREDPTDALVSNKFASLDQMPGGSIVGSCSLRRRCIIRSKYPDLRVENLRGNVNTRLKRLDDDDYDALILASSGLKRLEMHDRIRQCLPVEEFLPAVGQGALGIECRIDDDNAHELIAPLDHKDTHVRVAAERSANAALEGGCHVPIAVYAQFEGEALWVRGLVGEPEGGKVLYTEIRGAAANAEELGATIAEELLKQGAGAILSKVYAAS
jgi:hydroxymethylbilane synthase